MTENKPRAVIINDIHFSISTLPLAEAALRMACQKADELDVPLVLAGDIFNDKAMIRGECLNSFWSIICNTAACIIAIPGNHDMVNEKSKEHVLRTLELNCNVFDKVEFNEYYGIWLVPYMSNTSELEKLFALNEIPKGATVIMHQGVVGADMGHYMQDPSAMSQELFKDYRVISGHYHKRQDIQCGEIKEGKVGLFSYTGNPYTLSFGEANHPPKGFHVLMEDGSLEFIPTNLRKHVILERRIDNVYTPATATEPGDLIWLKVSGPRSELDKLTKKEIGQRLFGHTNFKLDKLPTDVSLKVQPQERLSNVQLLDNLIDNTTEKDEHKKYLKDLYKELLSDTTKV